MNADDLLLAVALSLTLAGCLQPDPDDKAGCVADIECKQDRLCEDGVCVEPSEPSGDGTNNASKTTGPTTNGPTNNATNVASTNGDTNVRTNARTIGDETCIDRSKEELSFPLTAVGSAEEAVLTITNCGVQAEEFEASIFNDSFSIASGAVGTLEPEESHDIAVRFEPEEGGEHRASLDLELDSGILGTRITGKAIETTGGGDCPQAVAEAKLSDSSRWQSQINTIPLKTIEFRGTNSIDSDGTIEHYEWLLVERPTNSTTSFEPSNDVAEPSLFLDLAGDYLIELNVFDDDGNPSCGEPAQIQIRATPDEDIHIQLVWDTPADPDQTDTDGTDVDLHFLHPNGTWNNLPFDIFWNNPTNEWGAPGADDNPSLDIDDTDGAGPENINLTDPESGLTYAVGAYYYAANGFEESIATVRIYIRGQESFEASETLQSRGSFWYAATISWPTTNIFEVGQTQQGFPNR